MSEGLSRKKKVRGGHKSPAKHTIAALYETIESTENPDSKLEQCTITLKEKLDTLKQLDEEILVLLDDEEVEDKIEQADIFRERIQVAIIDATAAIEGRKSKQNPPAEVSRAESDEVNSGAVSTSDVTESTTTTTSTSTRLPPNLPQPLQASLPYLMTFRHHHPLLLLILLVGHTPLLYQLQSPV